MFQQAVNAEMHGVSEKEERNEDKTENRSSSINMALIGGAVGVGVGLLSSKESGKKAISAFGKSEFFKTTSEELKRAANEILTVQAQKGIRQFASGYLASGQEGAAPEAAVQSDYEEMKEENQQLNDRLDRIEKMLGALADSGLRAD